MHSHVKGLYLPTADVDTAADDDAAPDSVLSVASRWLLLALVNLAWLPLLTVAPESWVVTRATQQRLAMQRGDQTTLVVAWLLPCGRAGKEFSWYRCAVQMDAACHSPHQSTHPPTRQPTHPLPSMLPLSKGMQRCLKNCCETPWKSAAARRCRAERRTGVATSSSGSSAPAPTAEARTGVKAATDPSGEPPLDFIDTASVVARAAVRARPRLTPLRRGPGP